MQKSDETKRVFFYGADGIVNVLTPAPGCELTFEEICKKDVPAGVKYYVGEFTDIPADHQFWAAWEIDPKASPDGDGVGHDAWYAAKKGTADG